MHPTDTRAPGADLRGLARLLVEGTRATTTVVEDMHAAVAAPWPALPRRLVYGQIRGVTQLVGLCLDGALRAVTPLLRAQPAGPQREAVRAALNGVLGDYLAATGNPLAVDMALRVDGRTLPATGPLALAGATGRILLLVHGSSMSDGQWTRRGHDHGQALAARLGATPVYLHYNSGLHIGANGATLADQLESVLARWPVPVESLSVLAYSMGGLVTRSAVRRAERDGLTWRRHLQRVVFIGTPHHGAPLERAGNWLESVGALNRYTRPLTRLGQVRSAGITDLRYGALFEPDAAGPSRFAPGRDDRPAVPLPAGVECFAIAGQLGTGRTADLRGDGLVPVSSALGHHPDPQRDLGLAEGRRFVVPGVSHLDLLADPRVFETLCAWVSPSSDDATTRRR